MRNQRVNLLKNIDNQPNKQNSGDVLKIINTHYVSYNSLVHVINEKRRYDRVLLSFIVYALFLFIMAYIAIDFHNPFLSHEYASGLRQSLYETEFPSSANSKLMTSFRDVDNENDFWEWFDEILSRRILQDEDYDVFDSHRLLWGVRGCYCIYILSNTFETRFRTHRYIFVSSVFRKVMVVKFLPS